MKKIFLLIIAIVSLSIGSVYAKRPQKVSRSLTELKVDNNAFLEVLKCILNSEKDSCNFEKMCFWFYAEQSIGDTTFLYFDSSTDLNLPKQIHLEGFVCYKKHYFFCENMLTGFLEKTNKLKNIYYYDYRRVFIDDSFPRWIFVYTNGQFSLLKKIEDV
jgi:hypothetical protein